MMTDYYERLSEQTYGRLTDPAAKAMRLAIESARRLNHEYVGTEHILLGIAALALDAAMKDEPFLRILARLGIDLGRAKLEVEGIVPAMPPMQSAQELLKTPRAKKALAFALDETDNLQHGSISVEHLLLGLLRENEGVAAQVLMLLSLKLEDLREAILFDRAHAEAPQETQPNSGDDWSPARQTITTLTRRE